MSSHDFNVQTALVEHADKIEYTKLVAVYKINKEYVSVKRLDNSHLSMSVISQQLKLVQLFIRKFKTLKRALATIFFLVFFKNKEIETAIELAFQKFVIRDADKVKSDPSEKSASCALSVCSGSFNDPSNALGLAHLCEHMILAGGSKKYGHPLAFHEELSRNNGIINAYTSGEQTVFYFNMPNANMLRSTDNYTEIAPYEKLLEMFSSYFEDPLFKNTIITKEINAINNEHFGNMANNGRILFHATRLLANKTHPFSRFATGNINTLRNLANLEKINLQSELKKYFEENYHASNNMTLCLKGSQSLNALAKLATQNFNGINIDFNILKEVWEPKIGAVPLFDNETKSNLICVDSPSSSIARLIFPVFHKGFRKYSERELKTYYGYWVDILGEESKYSFDDYLKSSEFCSETSSYQTRFALSNDGLVFQMKLTKKGWQNLDIILHVFFNQYINKILNATTENLASTLSESNATDLLKFLYQDSSEASKECSYLCAEILTKNFNDAVEPALLLKSVPSVGSLGDSYNESDTGRAWWNKEAQNFQKFVENTTTPENVKIVLLGSLEHCALFENLPLNNEKDLNYEFEYAKGSFIISSDANREDLVFDLPSKNSFLPKVASKTSLVKQALETSRQQSKNSFMNLVIGNSMNHSKPQKIAENSQYEYWIKDESHSNIFKSKSVLSVDLASTMLKPSPLNTMFLEILTELIRLTIGPKLYAAVKVGYSFSVTPSPRGDVKLKVSMAGFTDGLTKILKILIKVMNELKVGNFSKEVFRKSRVNVRSKYQEASQGNCMQLATIGLYISLEKYVWPFDDRMNALENDIDSENFQQFMNHFLTSLHLLVIQHGDIGESHKSINAFVSELLANNTKNVLDLAETRAGAENDPNNCTTYFLQTGLLNNLYDYTLTALTEFILSLTLVPDLRHKRQIGYVVTGGVRAMSKIYGIHVSAMSSSAPEYLDQSIEDYLMDLEHELEKNYTKEKFTNAFVKEYLKILQSSRELGKLENSPSGESDMLEQVQPNYEVGRGHGSLLESQHAFHKKLCNAIASENHDFNFSTSNQPVNLELLKKLTLSEYMTFFKTRISVKSLKRSKVSIHIVSKMNEKDKMVKMMSLQLEAFLKIKGFNIPTDKLHEIVEKNGTNTSALMKDLYRYFSSQGESLKFVLTGLKEILKALSGSLKLTSSATDSSSSPGIKRMKGTLPMVGSPSVIVNNPNYFRETYV
ncbi:hypothetical protein ACO0QE_001510 [Hanseniaspora vineae]